MAETGQIGSGENAGQISVGQIFHCARVLLDENWRRSLLVWFLMGVVELADASSQVLLGDRPFERGASLLISVVLSLMLSGVAIRALIGSLERMWTIDRALWEYVKTSVVLTVPLGATVVISILLARYGLLFVGMVGVFVLGIAVNIRGMLWPIGQLLGEEGASFRQSAARMRGVLASAVGAYLVLGLVLVIPKVAIAVLLSVLQGGSDIQEALNIALEGTLGAGRAIGGVVLTCSVVVLVSLRDRDRSP